MKSNQLKFGKMSKGQAKVFYGRLEEIEQKVLREFIAANPGNAEAAEQEFRSAINLKEVLNKLPANKRRAILSEYSSLIRFQETLNAATGLRRIKMPKTGKFVNRFDVYLGEAGEELNPLAVIYNRMAMGDHYATGRPRIGTNILKSEHLQRLTQPITGKIKAGSKVLMLDIETDSLATGGIREIAGHRMHAAERKASKGVVSNGTDTVLSFTENGSFQHTLDTAKMQLGSLRNAGNGTTMTLDEVALAKMGIGTSSNPGVGSGDALATVMDDVMKQIRDADVIVGHNLAFDARQIFTGTKATSRFKMDASFRRTVLEAEKQLNLKVVDTLEYAKQILPNLETSKELLFKGSSATHSMENIMRNTNLIDLIIKDLGAKSDGTLDVEAGKRELLKLFSSRADANSIGVGGAVHVGEIDAKIEGYFLKSLIEGTIKEEEFVPGEDTILRSVRSAMDKSYAITPTTSVSDAGDIADNVLKRLYDGGKIQVFDPKDDLQLGVNAKDKYESFEEAKKALRSEHAPLAEFNVTPVEHSVLSTRDLGMRVSKRPEGSGIRANAFADFAGADRTGKGFMNANGTLFHKARVPGIEAYQQFQKRAAQAGDHLAGLSLVERTITEGAHRVSLSDSTVARTLLEPEKEAARLSGDSGISYFSTHTDAYIKRGTGEYAISLNPEFFKRMEQTTIEEDGKLVSVLGTNVSGRANNEIEMVRVSTFRSKTGEHYANLMVDVSEEDTRRLASYLRNVSGDERTAIMKTLGESSQSSDIERLASVLERSADYLADAANGETRLRGISIAQLTGKSAEDIADIMGTVANSPTISADESDIVFRAGLLDTEPGVARVGAFISTENISEGERIVYGDNVRRAYKNQVRAQRAIADGSAVAETVSERTRRALGRMGEEMSDSLVEAATRGVDHVTQITRHLPKVAAFVGAALVAKKGYDMYKERSQLSETFEFQGYENNNDYYNLQQQAASLARARSIEPLGTAGVTATANRMRTGHTQMGPNRNSHLFSGAF